MLENTAKHTTPTQKLLNSIVDNAFVGIMVLNSIRDEQNEIVDFKWIFANQMAAKFVGFEVDELIGSRMLDLLPGSRETGLFHQYKNVVEKDELNSFVKQFNAEDLDTWFQLSANKLEDGLTVTFQDISHLKKTEAELKTKGKKYQKLFDESLDAIYLLDDALNFLTVNSSLLDLFGYQREQLVGSSIQRFFAADEDFETFKEDLQSNKKIEEVEILLLTSDQNKIHCLVHCVPLYDEEKRQQNYLGVIRDNSKRKQAEKEILMAEKLATTGKIARTIAHEIRNPLTNISLALEQLKDITPQVEESETYFNIIERSANRIVKLINDLLSSSKPKALKLRKQPVKQVISETLDLVKDRLNLKKMALVETYPEYPVEVDIDAEQFKIALLNLLINAIEAMEPDHGILEIAVEVRDGLVDLVIKDNGKGISEEDLYQLFEPFFTAKKGGSGLGLTTVQNIIHGHNGKINVESEVGKGTKFTITLPFNL